MDAKENREAHVAKLLQEAIEARLHGAEWASEQGLGWLAQAYNGIGPEFLPEALREKISSTLSIFESAALIHDARNHVSDATKDGFLAANDEFRANCLILADRAYGMFNPRRYRARAVAEILYLFVSADRFGWRAWLEAHERATN